MDIRILNPLDYPNWDELLLANGNESFFHTSGWAKVLVEGYGYIPRYFVSMENDEIFLLSPFMEIRSALTGRRGVSLPFADYCHPFVVEKSLLAEANRAALDFGSRSSWRFAEWRSSHALTENPLPSISYLTHDIDLRKPEAGLFSALKPSNRRNIQRAIKEGARVRLDSSSDSLETFYALHCLTRRRHGLPPQPRHFFKQVHEHVLSRGLGIIASALFAGKVIASAIFFHFGTRAIFKYGASDPRYLMRRPNNLLIWQAMRWYKDRGIVNLNLGRTEADNRGLRSFKLSWGSAEGSVDYYHWNFKRKAYSHGLRRGDYSHKIFSIAPDSLLRLIGWMFYRHIG